MGVGEDEDSDDDILFGLSLRPTGGGQCVPPTVGAETSFAVAAQTKLALISADISSSSLRGVGANEQLVRSQFVCKSAGHAHKFDSITQSATQVQVAAGRSERLAGQITLV